MKPGFCPIIRESVQKQEQPEVPRVVVRSALLIRRVVGDRDQHPRIWLSDAFAVWPRISPPITAGGEVARFESEVENSVPNYGCRKNHCMRWTCDIHDSAKVWESWESDQAMMLHIVRRINVVTPGIPMAAILIATACG